MSQEDDFIVGTTIRAAQIIVPCRDLPAALDFFTGRLGFRLDLIFPADAPETAVITGHGVTLRLETAAGSAEVAPVLRLFCDMSALPDSAARDFSPPEGLRVELADADPPLKIPDGTQEFVVSRAHDAAVWGLGRAGMQYRDLIPGRLGGRFVASHIRIPDGGPVPDYVHFHKVRFQMIYGKAGWARLVYEDQGPPFLLEAGDCVLQPPEIRHRVLEASDGLEVIEIGGPALHETRADHEQSLPTPHVRPERLFGGQQFVRHIARNAAWQPGPWAGCLTRDTGIAAATQGLAAVRVIKAEPMPQPVSYTHAGEFLFLFVLQGKLAVNSRAADNYLLRAGDSCVLPAGREYNLRAATSLEILVVSLPAE